MSMGGFTLLIPENVGNQRVILITLITDDTVYALVMRYRIGKDKKGTTLACLACNHTERVQDFKESVGNPRTLAAQAMLKHVYAEHSHETPYAGNGDGQGTSARASITYRG
jgi:hypothetical protein